MSSDNDNFPVDLPQATIEDVKRVLDLGRILQSVLTPKELQELERIINQTPCSNFSVTGMEN